MATAPQQTIDKGKIIGTVTADDDSPSFDIFRFKAQANEYVNPGTLVACATTKDRFLLGRVVSAVEVNPHESPGRVSVRHAMDIQPDYPEEGLSTTVYRVYEADVIEQGSGTPVVISDPQDLPKAGANVFFPDEETISKAMGFSREPATSLKIGSTRIAGSSSEESTNVVLKSEIIQRHIFVGGTTGSGKSWGTAILIEEINKLGVPVIILDSQREYQGVAKGLGCLVLVPGKDYSVEISSLTESEALQLVPSMADKGRDLFSYSFLRLKKETNGKFGLSELLRAMEDDAPRQAINANSLGLALQRTSSSIGRHKFIGPAADWGKLLKSSLINIDCGNLDQGELQLIVGTTLRELNRKRKLAQVPPYVIVLDEAHLLVPEHEDTPCKQVIRENVRIGRLPCADADNASTTSAPPPNPPLRRTLNRPRSKMATPSSSASPRSSASSTPRRLSPAPPSPCSTDTNSLSSTSATPAPTLSPAPSLP